MQNAKCKMLNCGSATQLKNAECKMQNAKCRISGLRRKFK